MLAQEKTVNSKIKMQEQNVCPVIAIRYFTLHSNGMFVYNEHKFRESSSVRQVKRVCFKIHRVNMIYNA